MWRQWKKAADAMRLHCWRADGRTTRPTGGRMRKHCLGTDKAKLPLYVETDKKQLTFLKADWDEAEVRKEFTKIPQLPIKKGKELGKISYCVGNEELYSFKICAAEDIRKWDFATFLTAVLKEFLL